MKKLIVFVAICLIMACKKDSPADDVTAYSWVLRAQVISPAITINGKTSTDYLSFQNPEGCTKNHTLSFYSNGVFARGSNGALCDMVANSDQQKWTKEGNQLILNDKTVLILNDNTLTGTSTLNYNGANYTITSTYTATKIK